MLLSLPERERLMVYTAAKLAQERRERGVKLNLPEATAVITSFVLEGARDGRSKADLQDACRGVLNRDDVMDGVMDMLFEIDVEATFPDGTKIVAVQEPIR
jgi:urease subunit gamma